MSLPLVIPLTLFGQPITGLRLPIGCTAQFDLTCLDPATKAALSLAGRTPVLAISRLDTMGNPVSPAIISRNATVTSAGDGLAYAPIASGDTVPAGVPYPPGSYGIEAWIEETATGDRVQSLGFGTIALTPAARLPDATVNPLPAQALLGSVALEYTMATRPDATLNRGLIIHVTDLGSQGALQWSDGGAVWRCVTPPYYATLGARAAATTFLSGTQIYVEDAGPLWSDGTFWRNSQYIVVP